MKKRYTYTILFGIPGFFIALIITIVISAGMLGILWIYFFGDDPWTASAEMIISTAFGLIFLTVWIASIAIGYIIGKKLEEDPVLNKDHVLISGGLTLIFILFIAVQQWRVESIGPSAEDTLCGEYCTRQGYSGSGMPPRNSGDRSCSCYDSSGNEVLKIPMDTIDPGGSK